MVLVSVCAIIVSTAKDCERLATLLLTGIPVVSANEEAIDAATTGSTAPASSRVVIFDHELEVLALA